MRRLKSGFTLVELMIVVAIIGILASLAIYGVDRYISNAKAAEAKQHVGAISRGSQAAFERTFGQSDLVGEGGLSSIEEHTLCGSALPVPPTPPAGTKYQPVTADGSDFNIGTSIGGWKCLRFSIESPIHYSYSYTRNSATYAPLSPTACLAPPCYEAVGRSDLNGDLTNYGVIARHGTINPATGALKATSYLYVLQEAQ